MTEWYNYISIIITVIPFCTVGLQSITIISKGTLVSYENKLNNDKGCLKASKPKWVNSNYILYGTNSLKLEDRHLM